MTDCKTAWLAGLVDGEGYIAIRLTHYKRKQYPGKTYKNWTLVFRIEMCDQKTVQHAAELYGYGEVKPIKPRSKRHSTSFRWEITGWRAADILQRLLPYLVTKLEEAKLGIEFASLPVFAGQKVPLEVEAQRTVLAAKLRGLRQRPLPRKRAAA